MSAYDPQVILDAWLTDGWQQGDECQVATVFLKPDLPGRGWGCSLGTWQQSHPRLHGFSSAWEAWAFVFAATGIDAHASLPPSVRRYESAAQPDALQDAAPEQTPWMQISLL